MNEVEELTDKQLLDWLEARGKAFEGAHCRWVEETGSIFADRGYAECDGGRDSIRGAIKAAMKQDQGARP